ncbi:ORF046 [Staphylococcus phage 55]|uniref:ORF046 n=1 Tax=Staphylococcus phage 55 TaxID=2936817 RepID=Q4ZBC0_9CAUD|nr:ORF046 [Staphylococcus phage 55]AAX91687.1 ORF046 [Staphylococcus phage 55]
MLRSSSKLLSFTFIFLPLTISHLWYYFGCAIIFTHSRCTRQIIFINVIHKLTTTVDVFFCTIHTNKQLRRLSNATARLERFVYFLLSTV